MPQAPYSDLYRAVNCSPVGVVNSGGTGDASDYDNTHYDVEDDDPSSNNRPIRRCPKKAKIISTK